MLNNELLVDFVRRLGKLCTVKCSWENHVHSGIYFTSKVPSPVQGGQGANSHIVIHLVAIVLIN